MKRFLVLLGVIALTFLVPTASFAATVAKRPPLRSEQYTQLHPETLTAHGVVVIDEKTGVVLFEKNADKSWPAASLSKVVSMMVYLSKNPSLSKRVTLKKGDEVGGGRLQAPAGTTLTAKDAFFTSLVASTNNTVMILQRESGLTPTSFVKAMNDTVAKLTVSPATVYYEPTGMDPRNHVTARDMATIIKSAVSKYPLIKTAMQTGVYRFDTANPLIKKTVNNTNALLRDSTNAMFITAGKTGYLEESLYNLAVRVETEDHTKSLIVVTLGADTKQHSFEETERLTKWAWKSYDWAK